MRPTSFQRCCPESSLALTAAGRPPAPLCKPALRPLVLALVLGGLGSTGVWADEPAATDGTAATAPVEPATAAPADPAAPAPAEPAQAPAPAATMQAPSGEAPAGGAKRKALETVVVTAQKRKEDIKEVPMSVSAISGDELTQGQVKDVDDLTRNIPNVSFSAQGGAGPGLGNLEIRGVSSAAGSATVGVYLDDVSLTTRNLYSQGTAEPRFFDLERVEVLRGPQGTLYGAGSMGGTFRFISRQPDSRHQTEDVSAELSSTDHGGTNYRLEAVLNQPIEKDVAAFRLGIQTGHDSGYIDQVDPNTLRIVAKGINDVDWTTLKGSFKWTNETWSLTPSIFYQTNRSGDIDATYLAVGGYQVPVGAPTPNLALYQTSKIVREPGKDILSVPSLTLTGDVGFADFTGILSNYDRHFTRTQDGTDVNSSYIGSQISNAALANVVSFLPSAVYLDNHINQNSLELRLASKLPEVSKEPWSWVTGVYFSKEKTDVTDNEPVFGITQAFTNAGVSIYDTNQWVGGGIFDGAFPDDNSYFSDRHYVDRQESVFGEFTWYAEPELRLTAGLRYLRGSQEFHREGGYYFAGVPYTAFAVDTDASKATPRLALDWDVDAQNTLYATAAEGFRLGGANRPIPLTVSGVVSDLSKLGLSSAPNTFKPDSLWSYEVGSKSRFLDNRVNLDVAAFYIDWSDIQQDIYLPTAGFDFETNVGHATSTGLEIELKAKATDDLTLMANGGVVHAVFAEDVPSLGVDGNGVQNVRKGDPIEGVPKFNLSLGGEYRFELFDHGNVFRLNIQSVGSSHGTVVRTDPDYNRSSYTTVDTSWTMLFGSAWDLSLKVKNLTNDHTVLQHPNVQSVSEAYYLRPRTIGLSLTGSF